MDTLAIERAVENDLLALLAPLPRHRLGAHLGENPDYAAGRVAVGAEVRGDALGAGTGPSGYYLVDVTLDCAVYAADDPDSATLDALVSAVRAITLDSALLAALNAISPAVTYHGWDLGPCPLTLDGRLRRRALTFSLWLNPCNATTTTTTT